MKQLSYIEKHRNFNRELQKKLTKLRHYSSYILCVPAVILFGDILAREEFEVYEKVNHLHSVLEAAGIAVIFLSLYIFLIKVPSTLSNHRIDSKNKMFENTVLPLAVKIEQNMFEAVSKSLRQAMRQTMKKEKLPVRTDIGAGLHIASLVQEAGRSLSLDQEINHRICRVMFPNYDEFEANDFFSFESFGEDSTVYFEFLEFYFRPSTHEQFEQQKDYDMTEDDFKKAQKLYAMLLMKIDAYHTTRIDFETLAEQQKTIDQFKKQLESNYQNMLEHMQLHQVNLIELKRNSYKLGQTQNIVENFEDLNEYAQKLMYFK